MLKLARALAARDRREESVPRRRRRAELRRQRQDAARRQLRATSGSSRRPAMPAARSAPRSRPITCSTDQPRKLESAHATACTAPISARATRRRTSSAGCRAAGARFEVLERGRNDRRAARRRLPMGKAVGWFQGRMEFGPRALGGRSILGDRALADDAEDAQPQGQVPRIVPARSRPRCCARMSPTGSSSTTTAPTCCWSPTCSPGTASR